MNWAVAGSICLGVITAYIAMMYITRDVEKNSGVSSLTGFLAVLVSGTVIQFLTSKIGANATNFAQYAVGLGGGFVLYLIAYAIRHGGLPTILGYSLSGRRSTTAS
jgi:hypothetical protein